MNNEDSIAKTTGTTKKPPVNLALDTIEEAILITTVEVCRRLSIGKSLFFRLLSSGQVGPKKIMLGRRVLWNNKEMGKWADAGCPSREQWQQMKEENN